jgi:hypothetical protein
MAWGELAWLFAGAGATLDTLDALEYRQTARL